MKRLGTIPAVDSTLLSIDEEVELNNLSRPPNLYTSCSELLTFDCSPVFTDTSRSKSLSVDWAESMDDSWSDNVLNVLRRNSITKWNEQDLNDLHKELMAETRFLKMLEDLTKIKMELKTIKHAGGRVLDLSEKVERYEIALKTTAKEKFSQEKKLCKLRSEISYLKERRNSMEECVYQSSGRASRIGSTTSEYPSGISVRLEEVSKVYNPKPYPVGDRLIPPTMSTVSATLSRWSTSDSLKMREQHVLLANLHRKIDILELQNKDKEINALKIQVNMLSETVEKLIGGMQDVSSRNPLVVAKLDNLKNNLPNSESSHFRNVLSLPLSCTRASSANIRGKNKTRHIWVSRLKERDFKVGPISFIL